MRVVATAASGVAEKTLGRPCEDTISLHATWQNVASGSTASASYTASWIAPPTDVHTQQRFFAMSHGGEVTVDQAHRGYSVSTDGEACETDTPLSSAPPRVAGARDCRSLAMLTLTLPCSRRVRLRQPAVHEVHAL